MNLQPYLDFATSLAYRAGRITMGYYNTGVRADMKENNEPVTIADHEAEKFIRAEIERQYPGHAIIGEEFGHTTGNGVPFRWTIDPIDGTKSFIRSVPLYGVLIGLEIEGKISVGAAYYPPLDEMLCAADGLGCWWNSRRAHVSTVDEISQACVVTSDFQRLAEKDSTLTERFAKKKALLRTWGDAYGYMLVATGRAEVCVDPFLDIWDYGPYPVILREAGGYFGTWSGQEGHTPGDALACNAALKQEVVKLMMQGS
ncbi:inositol monophosphatase family protein [Candidatus Villigracilis affinis]|uniref:inositol monophosphatase family protein n=1 Tax=Candidatus Villigracilis affinis TaxID=3140682 RepID=UPI002A1D7E49|nr:histidinol phosphate phosphatase [Anaerolineales bacterium]